MYVGQVLYELGEGGAGAPKHFIKLQPILLLYTWADRRQKINSAYGIPQLCACYSVISTHQFPPKLLETHGSLLQFVLNWATESVYRP